ncbi:hypothetical protein SAMD00079811_71330 [Scytonema sp. HK-05]|nr:hypothetical protein SAMD00079811_71330 [Scytonema sp. HK-05]
MKQVSPTKDERGFLFYLRIQVLETQLESQFQNCFWLINIPLVAIRHENLGVV